MNANELAEGILAIEERIFLTKKEHQLFQNSATMLRQQQAAIEALKEGIEKLKDAYCQKDHEVKKAEQYCLDAFDRGRQIGYADGMINRKAQEK